MPEINETSGSTVLFENGDIWGQVEKALADETKPNPPAADPVKTDKPETQETLSPEFDNLSLGEEDSESKEKEPNAEEDPKEEIDEEKEGPADAYKVINKLIEDGELLGFADGKPVRRIKDLKYILQNQAQTHRKEGAESYHQELAESLPTEGRIMLDYILNGGDNLQEDILRPIFEYKEIDAIDTTTEFGKEQIIRQGFAELLQMEPKQIEEELQILKDAKLLDQKAEFLKNKLKEFRDKQVQKNQQLVAQRRQQQELQIQAEQQERNSQLSKVFSGGVIAGIPVDNKTKKSLVSTFTTAYTSQITNQPVDFVTAVVEYYTKVKPNYEFMARLHWFLQDTEGYHRAIKTEATKDVDTEYRKQAMQLPNGAKGNKVLPRPS